jgi:hypothetical protein
VNRPGTIYRVDTATGKASVFFDMASMIQKLQNQPTADASNGVSNSSGLVNWYDITFDPEGYFFGRSAMLVSTVSNNDPTKNAVYAIGSDGSLIGALVQFTAQSSSQNFAITPTAVLVPPVEYQKELRGLFTGSGTPSNSSATYTALFFDANTYRPGQNINTSVLPPGVSTANLLRGPQVGLTASNNLGRYNDQIFSAFTDFGVGSSGGLPGVPGFSGVEGTFTGLFISPNPTGGTAPPYEFLIPTAANPPIPSSTNVDSYATAETGFRRFQDIAFDQFGYFSYGSTVTPATGTTTIPTYVGSMFVTDMGNGMAVTGAVTVGATAYTFYAPVTGGILSYDQQTQEFVDFGNTLTGGRVLRIAPDGTMTPFAENFNIDTSKSSTSFINSSLSITFSADGTKMWVSDDDGIWQFASTLSLAGSTTGNQIGLNDLRSLGVPYEGQNSAVAVLDTGVDATNTSFRGRVARGIDINKRRGPGNIDTSSTGHGTNVAGVVAQLVPEATIQPINMFVVGATPTAGGTGGTTTTSLGVTSNQAIFKALQFLSKNPFVNDPVRPGQKDRIVASTLAWGTQTSFPTEGQAFQAFPQVVASFKQQLARIRKLGITTVASAGQFGVPQGGTSTTGGTTTVSSGDFNGMAMPAVLNEVVSVGMTSPMPFYLTPNSDPTDPNVGPNPRAFLPIQFRTTSTTGGTTTGVGYGQVATMTNGQPFLYSDDMLYSSNASITTDYVAPGVDVPTFNQTTGSNTDPLKFDIAGTSMSAGLTAGSFALVGSAVNYWTNLARAGATSDAYLTQPVGTNTLNFGKGALKSMSLYANPDGINSILQWTAVPVNYNLFNDIGAGTTGGTTTGNVIQPQTNLSYSRIDVGNAIAAIEGEVAMQYLLQNGTFSVIDSNKNGMITAGELQNFTNNAQAMGMAEAGAMARLLGGTSTYDAGATEYVLRSQITNLQGVLSVQQLDDVPDPAGVLARRFNYFDYAADGQINGFLTVDQIKTLSQTLLPRPDGFSIIDRTRSSANSYLLDPEALRNYNEITKLNYSWVYATAANLKKYRNFSPAQWGVNKGQNDRSNPTYVLFDGPPTITSRPSGKGGTAVTGGSSAGSSSGSSGVAAGSGGSSTGTGTSSGTGSSAGSSSSNGGNQAALMAALQALATGGKVVPVGTTSSTPTSTTGAGSLQGSSNLNKKLVAQSPTTPQLNILNQPVRPARSKSALQSIASKIGLGKIV